jgi:two-component system sensor histidine kinase ChvG
MLDQIQDRKDAARAEAASPASRRVVPLARLIQRRLARTFGLLIGSSLVRRILFVNMLGLVALLLGFLWLNQTRLSVIDSRVQSLKVQGEIIAAALAGTAVVDGDGITFDADKLLDLQVGETATEDPGAALQFSLDPERAAVVLRSLVTPTQLRARIYDRDGAMLLDTRGFYGRGDITRLDIPTPVSEAPLFERSWSFWKRRFGRTGLAPSDEPGSGRSRSEIQRALGGVSVPVVRITAAGDTIITYAFPIQRLRAVRGVLELTTQDGDIDEVIAEERLNIFIVFGAILAVMALVSLMMANTIAKPVERLAVAAERVRRGIKTRHEIPDFSERNDEIGHLSGALRDMTNALYNRIAAIESFAADVAHELKNPLTSLRSAVETLPLVKTDEARKRLLGVIQHDVKRLDRLISDISDASRLDAELARGDATAVDMVALLTAVTSLANDAARPEGVPVRLSIRKPLLRGAKAKTAFYVTGHDSRLGQVFTNLIDNARSFSPEGGEIRMALERAGTSVVATIEDDGPGVPEHARERIFERFYTDRPAEHGFGQNSGLGLSISRQIIEAHRGAISVEDGRDSKGARFRIVLPAADSTA